MSVYHIIITHKRKKLNEFIFPEIKNLIKMLIGLIFWVGSIFFLWSPKYGLIFWVGSFFFFVESKKCAISV